ncbi:MAG: hypothetical protein ISS70_02070 [Phycisphaerae bacterium]|nr:hypothetical protein [Phycisphaerae bacterium]
MSSKQTNMNTDDRKLKVIVFKACHVAVWSDATMTSEERRSLSHLTEALCKTQQREESSEIFDSRKQTKIYCWQKLSR